MSISSVRVPHQGDPEPIARKSQSYVQFGAARFLIPDLRFRYHLSSRPVRNPSKVNGRYLMIT
ncbi:hypothetical protein CHS0354_001435, partial [Potamilus streckersoni]